MAPATAGSVPAAASEPRKRRRERATEHPFHFGFLIGDFGLKTARRLIISAEGSSIQNPKFKIQNHSSARRIGSSRSRRVKGFWMKPLTRPPNRGLSSFSL